MARYYAQDGINWEFLYEVLHEDDDILVLKDLGRFHKFDEDRMWKRPIDAYFDIFGEFARIGGKMKLVEVQG